MITIFTPTFNRADKLPRLYQSLRKQSCFDFEWLIVDDGSSDDTEAVVRGFDTSLFPIRYHRKENGGKHTAYNAALEIACGEYFFCVDSDDWLASDAVRVLQENEGAFLTPLILAYKTDDQGKLLSGQFPEKTQTIGLKELYERHGCSGEFTFIFKTEFARTFPFPVFSGERFITEAVVYDRMGEASAAFLLPCVITVCEYQPDGLSRNLNRIMKNNPAGYCLYFMQRIDWTDSWKRKLVLAGKYRCFCIFAKGKKTVYEGKHRFLVDAVWPLGLLFWFYYKLARGF